MINLYQTAVEQAEHKIAYTQHLQPLCPQEPAAPLTPHPFCFTQPYEARYANVLKVNSLSCTADES